MTKAVNTKPVRRGWTFVTKVGYDGIDGAKAEAEGPANVIERRTRLYSRGFGVQRSSSAFDGQRAISEIEEGAQPDFWKTEILLSTGSGGRLLSDERRLRWLMFCMRHDPAVKRAEEPFMTSSKNADLVTFDPETKFSATRGVWEHLFWMDQGSRSQRARDVGANAAALGESKSGTRPPERKLYSTLFKSVNRMPMPMTEFGASARPSHRPR